MFVQINFVIGRFDVYYIKIWQFCYTYSLSVAVLLITLYGQFT